MASARAPTALLAMLVVFGLARAGDPAADTAGAVQGEASRTAVPALVLRVPVVGIRRSALRDTYADRRGDRPHEALDIPAPRGTAVVAAAPGRIVKLFTSVPGGLTIYQFDREQHYALYYAHLDRYAAAVTEGMPVEQGQVIGYVGTTGNAPPDAPHLHFAVFRLGPGTEWWKGTPVDAFDWLTD